MGETNELALPRSVYDALNRVQRRIAEEAHCLEDKYDLTIYAGEELYDFPDGMIHERMIIPSGSTQLRHISFDEVDRLKRSAQATDSTDATSDNLFFYYKWGGQFGFLMSDGGSPSDETTVSVYYWRYPSSTEEMSDLKDPLVEFKWDTTLFYGALAELTGDAGWFNKYEMELGRLSSKEATIRSEMTRIPTNRDYD